MVHDSAGVCLGGLVLAAETVKGDGEGSFSERIGGQMGVAVWVAGAFVIVMTVAILIGEFQSRKRKNRRKNHGTSGRIEG